MKRVGLFLLAAVLWADSPLQPNQPVTKDGITIAVRCPANDCSVAPAIVEVQFNSDAKWTAPVVLGQWYNGIYAAGGLTSVVFNGHAAFLVWQVPNTITNFIISPVNNGTFFGK